MRRGAAEPLASGAAGTTWSFGEGLPLTRANHRCIAGNQATLAAAPHAHRASTWCGGQNRIKDRRPSAGNPGGQDSKNRHRTRVS